MITPNVRVFAMWRRIIRQPKLLLVKVTKVEVKKLKPIDIRRTELKLIVVKKLIVLPSAAILQIPC